MVVVHAWAARELPAQPPADRATDAHSRRDRKLDTQAWEVAVRTGGADVQLALKAVVPVSLILDEPLGHPLGRTD